VGSEWPSPVDDPCETYMCEAVAGTVQKVQKVQKCDIHCELVLKPHYFLIVIMAGRVIAYVLVYSMIF
jgi:hypothetical protein